MRTGALLTAAYFAYVTATWLRYGRKSEEKAHDALLDRAIPEYEVTVRHHTTVHAPAKTTFDVIRTTDFERSPIVRALFRTREMLFHAKHAERPMPHALMDQLRSFGWTVLAEEEGREIVLGAVTQPWQPNPVFRSLSPNQFVNFNEPRFAKIVFTLRVDPLDTDLCEAVLSPGIDLIRRVLLAQIKAEAEAQYAAQHAPSVTQHW